MMRNTITLLTFLAVIAAGLGLTLIRPVALPRTIEVVPPATEKLVCPPMADPAQLFVDGTDTITTLGGDDVAATGPTHVSGQDQASVIRGGAALVGGVLAAGGGSRGWLPCTAPASRGTLIVPEAAGTDVVVVNPDASEAIVDLSLYGTDGEIIALGSRGIAVGPHSQRTVALSVLVDEEGPVGISYTASRGRATVVARTASADGVLEAATSAVPATEHWLAGVPAGATSASLLVTNTGNERAAVEVTAYGQSVAYQPEGGADVSVPAHSTIAVDLGPSLAGEATGLRVASDADVAVGLSTGVGADLAFSAPVTSSAQLGAYAPAGGVLQLSNPGEVDVRATVVVEVVGGDTTTATHTVAAGTTVSLPLEAAAPDGQVVAVTADQPLFGAVVESGSGVSAVPLSSTQETAVEPLDAEIVPTLR